MINFKEEPKIYNAKIKFSYLGFDQDASMIWWQLGFDCECGSFSTTKVCLYDLKQIANILSVLDLRSWEEVARKFVRIKVSDKQVVAIGNLIENKWIQIN